MRANMQQIANRHRADGQSAAEAIQSEADAKVTILLAQAQSQGQLVRAEGQAKAAAIYAQAFAEDKDFFAFYRSLKAYEASFSSKHDVLVLTTDSAFLRFFKDGYKFIK